MFVLEWSEDVVEIKLRSQAPCLEFCWSCSSMDLYTGYSPYAGLLTCCSSGVFVHIWSWILDFVTLWKMGMDSQIHFTNSRLDLWFLIIPAGTKVPVEDPPHMFKSGSPRAKGSDFYNWRPRRDSNGDGHGDRRADVTEIEMDVQTRWTWRRTWI